MAEECNIRGVDECDSECSSLPGLDGPVAQLKRRTGSSRKSKRSQFSDASGPGPRQYRQDDTIPEVIDELQGDDMPYTAQMARKNKNPAKKGEAMWKAASALANNDLGQGNMDLINGMSVRDAIMHIAQYREEKAVDPKKADKDKEFMWIDCKYS